MRIVLLGFRYSGKSTIGGALAVVNGFRFVDIDTEIERKTQQKISKIVEKNGWKFFRELELDEYKRHINEDKVVISCGGGFAVNEYFAEEEQQLLQEEKGVKILYEIDKECLIDRIKTGFDRPNVKTKNDIITENIELYESRYDAYNALDFDVKIDTSNDKIAKAIVKKTLCCVVGNPVWHSLSPKIHNFLYQTANLNDFVYTKCEIKPEKIAKLTEIITLFNFRGVSITSPYKQEVMKIIDTLDKKAIEIDAVNTIFIDNFGKLHGYNTDYLGVLNTLEKHINLTDKKVAVFGSGGGAKSAVIACLERTKNVVLFNRTKEKNDVFADENGIKSCSLNEFVPKDFDVIINATIVGLGTDESILTKRQILSRHIVFDMVYNQLKTTLLKNAISKGARVIYGTDMLIFQAVKQNEIYTGITANAEQTAKLHREIVKINHNICLVVAEKTLAEMTKTLSISQQKSDFVEIRADILQKITKKTINKIAEKICVDSIFTCRNVADGGSFTGTKNEQQNLIKYAMSLNRFTYFDIDFSQIDDWKKELTAQQKQYQIIVSYHNFERCLTYENCVKMIDKMFKSGAGIAKIACKIVSKSDIDVMVEVLKKYKNENKNVIFAPMCEDEIIRGLASKYGSWTNFVCLNNNKSTAMGQICIDNYNKIVGLVGEYGWE